MIELIETGLEWIPVMVLALARVLGAFLALTFLGPGVFGGALPRTAAAAGLTLVAMPLIQEQMQHIDASTVTLLLYGAKETVVGMLLGASVVFAFWGVVAVGNLIDNQRGATAAQSFDPMTGEQDSPLGTLLGHMVVITFFVTGLFTEFMVSLYHSYTFWAVDAYFPHFTAAFMDYLIDQFALIARIAVLIGGPIVMAMFLAEFGLGIVSRFAPQLNVFFLAMPIKSAVAVFLLMLYWTTFVYYLSDQIHPAQMIGRARDLMQ